MFEDSGLGRSVRTRKTRLGSIDASPGSSNYPKYQTIYGGAGHEHVAFDKFGDVLRERVDELHKKRFNKIPFFLHDETISENTITRAEQKLAELSNVNLRTLAGPPADHTAGDVHGFEEVPDAAKIRVNALMARRGLRIHRVRRTRRSHQRGSPITPT